MCRNIKTLFNFDPPASNEEIYDASLQFVRKVSGFNKPSKANEKVFTRAVEKVALNTKDFLESIKTNAAPRNRQIEAERARAKALKFYT